MIKASLITIGFCVILILCAAGTGYGETGVKSYSETEIAELKLLDKQRQAEEAQLIDYLVKQALFFTVRYMEIVGLYLAKQGIQVFDGEKYNYTGADPKQAEQLKRLHAATRQNFEGHILAHEQKFKRVYDAYGEDQLNILFVEKYRKAFRVELEREAAVRGWQ